MTDDPMFCRHCDFFRLGFEVPKFEYDPVGGMPRTTGEMEWQEQENPFMAPCTNPASDLYAVVLFHNHPSCKLLVPRKPGPKEED